jgi:hypothetical protein
MNFHGDREDKFELTDMPWLTTLRFKDPSQSQNKFYSTTGTVPDRAPHFYDQDMDHWK